MPLLTPLCRIGVVISLFYWTVSHSTTSFVAATAATIPVATAAELDQALATAQPGQTILLADGVYQGEFAVTQSGTAEQPITLQGSPATILAGEALTKGYVLHIDKADYWVLTGFTLRNAAKGIMLDDADNNTLDHLLIEQTGQEAVHFRTCSASNILQYSTIRETGVITPGYGEGIYIGSDADKWPAYSCDLDLRDKSHYNQILSNHFGPNVRAEAIDVKEGTVGGIISGNEFDATGLSGAHFADSWLDLKGNRYKVGYNHGVQGDTVQLRHGFETHDKESGWGRNNIFYANVFTLNSNGYGFHIDTDDPDHGTIVCANNQVAGAELGIANIGLTGSSKRQTGFTNNAVATLPLDHVLTTSQVIWLPLIQTFPCD